MLLIFLETFFWIQCLLNDARPQELTVNLKESQCITLGKEVFLLIQGKLASNAQFVEHGLYSEEDEEEALTSFYVTT